MWKAGTVFRGGLVSAVIVLTLCNINMTYKWQAHIHGEFSGRKDHGLIPANIQHKIISLGELGNQSSDELFSLIRSYCLEAPSNKPYHLKENSLLPTSYALYKTNIPSWIFIESVVKDLFSRKRRGFFVEAGALDGEYLSNTLALERKANWTGLLVEVEARNYLRLKKKRRKAWTAPVCLATKSHPHKVFISTSAEDENFQVDGGAKMHKDLNTSTSGSSFGEVFQVGLCIPTRTLLEALDVRHVDFFSLDVEGAEVGILQAFPFDKITVDVWAIEHFNRNMKQHKSGTLVDGFKEDENFIELMESNGYYLFDVFCESIHDYIFILRESSIFEDLEVPPELWRRKNLCNEKVFDENAMPDSLRDRRHWPTLKFNKYLILNSTRR